MAPRSTLLPIGCGTGRFGLLNMLERHLSGPAGYHFAALALVEFPGHYIGLAASPSRVQALWRRPSPLAGQRFHQTTWSATIQPEP
jgi:hypothetical protein